MVTAARILVMLAATVGILLLLALLPVVAIGIGVLALSAVGDREGSVLLAGMMVALALALLLALLAMINAIAMLGRRLLRGGRA